MMLKAHIKRDRWIGDKEIFGNPVKNVLLKIGSILTAIGEPVKTWLQIVAIVIGAIWFTYSFILNERRTSRLINVQTEIGAASRASIDGREFDIFPIRISVENDGLYAMTIVLAPTFVTGSMASVITSLDEEMTFRVRPGTTAFMNRNISRSSGSDTLSFLFSFPEYTLNPGESATHNETIIIPVDQNYSFVSVWTDAMATPSCTSNWFIWSECYEFVAEISTLAAGCNQDTELLYSFDSLNSLPNALTPCLRFFRRTGAELVPVPYNQMVSDYNLRSFGTNSVFSVVNGNSISD